MCVQFFFLNWIGVSDTCLTCVSCMLCLLCVEHCIHLFHEMSVHRRVNISPQGNKLKLLIGICKPTGQFDKPVKGGHAGAHDCKQVNTLQWTVIFQIMDPSCTTQSFNITVVSAELNIKSKLLLFLMSTMKPLQVIEI